MGYLDNSSITVDAIITKKGRELLSKGRDNFVITQFALADDEVDYNLWNPAHTQGSDYYGIIIENMPIIEATTDENFMMKYKLITLPKNTIRIPKVNVLGGDITLPENTGPHTVTINTINAQAATLGYTVTLLNSDAADIASLSGGIGDHTDILGATEDRRSITITCNMTFSITTKVLTDNTDITTKIIVMSNDTGARDEINLTVTNDPNISIANVIGLAGQGLGYAP
jgi:hypothetical protein